MQELILALSSTGQVGNRRPEKQANEKPIKTHHPLPLMDEKDQKTYEAWFQSSKEIRKSQVGLNIFYLF